MRDIIFREILDCLEEKYPIMLLLGDLGVFQARDIKSRFPENVFNIGILEQSMISFGAGLSKGGMIPIIYSITPFITERVLEQIKLDACYNQNNLIILSAGGTCDYWDLGPTHHAPNDISLLSSYQNIEYHTPFSSRDAKKIFRESIDELNCTKYIRLSSEEDSCTEQYYAKMSEVFIDNNWKNNDFDNVFIYI